MISTPRRRGHAPTHHDIRRPEPEWPPSCANRHVFEHQFEYDGGMTESPLAQAARLIEQAFALIDTSPESLAALLVIEGVSRRADRSKISRIATVDRDGDLAAKGYRSTSRRVARPARLGPRHRPPARDGRPARRSPDRAGRICAGTGATRDRGGVHRRGGHHAPRRGHRRADELRARQTHQPGRPGVDRGQPRRGRVDVHPARGPHHGAANCWPPRTWMGPSPTTSPAATCSACTPTSTAPAPSTASTTTRPRSPRSAPSSTPAPAPRRRTAAPPPPNATRLRWWRCAGSRWITRTTVR